MQVAVIHSRLAGIQPPVWRQLLLSSEFSLADLHEVLQAAFEWDDAHPHSFGVTSPAANSTPLDGMRLASSEEPKITLRRCGRRELIYHYADGEGWELRCEITSILELPGFGLGPYCVAGARAAPPEDSGGIEGYERLVQAVDEADNPEFAGLREWLGDWDPETLDLDVINEDLAELFA